MIVRGRVRWGDPEAPQYAELGADLVFRTGDPLYDSAFEAMVADVSPSPADGDPAAVLLRVLAERLNGEVVDYRRGPPSPEGAIH